MVLDILAAIGLKEAGSFLAKDVLMPLLQGSLEDYAKDFFKDCISDAAGLAAQEPVQKALGKALKAFVDLVQEELEFLGCSGTEIRDLYEIPLRQFIKDSDVKAVLGRAFEPDCRAIDAEFLPMRWDALTLPALPEEFDWMQIGKQYVRAVKGILRSSNELRDLLKLHNQEAMRQGIEELVGISPDFDLRKYQETLREQYGNLKLESLDTTGYAYNELKLWRMFIPQDVRTCQEFNSKVYEIPKEKRKELQQRGELDAEALEAAQLEEYRKTYVDQPIQNVLEVIGRIDAHGQQIHPVAHYVVVLGDPGSGKSTLLQYVALQWAEQPIRDVKELAQRPLPLLIELRKYARGRQEQKCSSIVEYLHQGDIACRLNQQRLHEVLSNGNVIALFDGIDEVFDPTLRDVVVTDIHRFTNNYPTVQTVVTSRWLGYKAQTLRDAGFQHYMLQDLTDEQTTDFVQRWHDQTFPEGTDKVRKRERLHKAIRESKAIRELAGNPLLLTMMAILNRNQELPRDRPELYNQASRVLLHQWDVERNLIEQRLDPVTIDYRDKQAMLRKVANHMQSGQDGLAGNIINAQDLEAILMEHLRFMEVDKPRKVARLMIQQLRERNFILCFLGGENYAFVHRTFLEYFAAWGFIWKFEKTQELDFVSLLEQTFGTHWWEESWREVLRLIAGMLEPSFVGEVIEFLIEQNGRSQRLTNMFLAAECLGEVRKRIEIQTIATTLLEKIKALTQFDMEFGYDELFDHEEKLIREIRTKAVSTVSTTWTESQETSDWLKTLAKEHEDYNVRQVAVQRLVRDFKDSKDILSWVKMQMQGNNNPLVQMVAIRELVRYFKDDLNTLKILKTRAYNNGYNSNIRSAAVQELAQHFKDDPDTLKILKATVQTDKDYSVRNVAIQSLAQYFKDDPDTLVILKAYIQTDKDYSVQSIAVKELARSFKDDPDTLKILKATVQTGKHYSVRSIAMKELMRSFKDDPETLEILKATAQTDKHYSVRTVALQELVCGFKNDLTLFEFWYDRTLNDPFERRMYGWDDKNPRRVTLDILVRQYLNRPKILELLKYLAQFDNDYEVRSTALQELARNFRNNPDTLLILKAQARTDKHYSVRRTAMQELIQGFKNDPDTLVILKSQAQDNTSYSIHVQIGALQELTRSFKNDPDILEILKSQATNAYSFVRSAAVHELVKHFKNDPDTLEILKSQAKTGISSDERSKAIQELARGFKDYSDLFEFMSELILNEQPCTISSIYSNPRQIALNTLLRQYPSNPKTFELLKDRAENDNNDTFRDWAAKRLTSLLK